MNQRWIRDTGGYFLPTTLMALVIMMAIIMTLAELSQVELKSSRYTADMVHAKYATISGLELAKAKLAKIHGGLFYYKIIDPAWTETGSNSADGPGIRLSSDELQLGTAQLKIIVDDESGKLDLNYLSRNQMAGLPGMSLKAADSVIDWRDPDGKPGESGAETDYYLAQGLGYPAKNRPFDTVDELSLVNGFSKDMMQSPGNGAPIRDYLTVWSLSPNLTPDGTGKIVINTATVKQLQERVAGLTKEEAQQVVTYATNKKFKSLGELFNVPGLTRRQIAAIVDYFDISSRQTLRGKVNINTAPYPVLKALTEDETVALKIINDRNNSGFYRTVGELVEDEAIPVDVLAKIVDYCTVGSYRFRVRINAVYGRARAGLSGIIDVSSRTPQVIYATFENP